MYAGRWPSRTHAITGKRRSRMTDQTRPLWHKRWFQYLILALLTLYLTSFLLPPLLDIIYITRSVLLPVVLALTLAYVVNPLVKLAHTRLKLPRPISAALIMLIAVIIITAILIYVLPKLVGQIEQLIRKLPGYADQLAERLGWDISSLGEYLHDMARSTFTTATTSADGATQATDLETIVSTLLSWLDVGYGVVSSTIGLFSYLILAVVVTCFCFFFFVWKFDPIIEWFKPFIPAEHRTVTLEIISKMDRTVSAFIRGRLIQALVVMVILSTGWALAGVPYWLLLGMLGGVLNLIPFAAVFAWPLAVLLAWLDAVAPGQAGFNLWMVLVWPSAVYFIAQFADNWVVEPLVQGQATEMDPLTVMLVVLLGATIAGLLGMLLAIPIAACIKILAQEVVLPRLRELAASAGRT